MEVGGWQRWHAVWRSVVQRETDLEATATKAKELAAADLQAAKAEHAVDAPQEADILHPALGEGAPHSLERCRLLPEELPPDPHLCPHGVSTPRVPGGT